MSYQFQGQRTNEEVVLISRQHPFVLFPAFLLVAGILLLPLLAFTVLLLSELLIGFSVVCLVVAIIIGWRAWHSWNSSLMLLTDQRVVVLNQHGLFQREFTECSLFSIQQVSHKVKGILQTTLGFGTIFIYTAGSHEPFGIPNVPDPYDIQQEIQKLAAE